MNNYPVWKSKEAADRYGVISNVLIPGRQEILKTIAEVATARTQSQPRILDLGCGYGDVSLEILKARPGARISLVDFSDEMLNKCHQAFGQNPNISYQLHDLNDGLPDTLQSAEYDAVVSSAALHHIEYANRTKLYSDIRQALKPGGTFINGDRIRADSPELEEREMNRWVTWQVAQMKDAWDLERTFEQVKQKQIEQDLKFGDKPGTIRGIMSDLQAAGYRYIDCLGKYQILAIIAATK